MTDYGVDDVWPIIISIHALLAESDKADAELKKRIDISIHALLAESDAPPTRAKSRQHDFYPRSPCGERRLPASDIFNTVFISIHALLAESDTEADIHDRIAEKFLSTLSLRRATVMDALYAVWKVFLSTLSLRRATTNSSLP